MGEVESGAVLPVAEDEISKASAEGIEGAGERWIEPIVTVLAVGLDGAFEVGHDQADAAAGLQHPVAVTEQSP